MMWLARFFAALILMSFVYVGGTIIARVVDVTTAYIKLRRARRAAWASVHPYDTLADDKIPERSSGAGKLW